jgi:hypothetical protein
LNVIINYLQAEVVNNGTVSLKDRSNPEYYVDLLIPNSSRVCKIKINNLGKVREIFKHKAFTKICDALLIDTQDKQIYLVELKKTLRLSSFREALVQLISTYMKFITILHLFENSADYEVVLLIASESYKLPNKERKDDLDFTYEKEVILESPDFPILSGYLKNVVKHGKTEFKTFPFYNEEFKAEEIDDFKINEIFQKEKVVLYFKEAKNGDNISL